MSENSGEGRGGDHVAVMSTRACDNDSMKAAEHCDIYQGKRRWWNRNILLNVQTADHHMHIKHIKKKKRLVLSQSVSAATSWCRLQQGRIWNTWDHPRHSRGLWPDNNQHIQSHRGHTDGVWPGRRQPPTQRRAVAVDAKNKYKYEYMYMCL